MKNIEKSGRAVGGVGQSLRSEPRRTGSCRWARGWGGGWAAPADGVRSGSAPAVKNDLTLAAASGLRRPTALSRGPFGSDRAVRERALLEGGGDPNEGGLDVFAGIKCADPHVPFAALAEAGAWGADDLSFVEQRVKKCP
ncbi:MAG: hypothetical protein RL077_121 [Verrucomicrobiota bacterium]